MKKKILEKSNVAENFSHFRAELNFDGRQAQGL